MNWSDPEGLVYVQLNYRVESFTEFEETLTSYGLGGLPNWAKAYLYPMFEDPSSSMVGVCGVGSSVAGIKGLTKHAIDMAIERRVTPKNILEALKNPLKINPVRIDNLGRPSQRIIGRGAEVVINPQTKEIVSVNPTSSEKVRRLLRLMGQ